RTSTSSCCPATTTPSGAAGTTSCAAAGTTSFAISSAASRRRSTSSSSSEGRSRDAVLGTAVESGRHRSSRDRVGATHGAARRARADVLTGIRWGRVVTRPSQRLQVLHQIALLAVDQTEIEPGVVAVHHVEQGLEPPIVVEPAGVLGLHEQSSL